MATSPRRRSTLSREEARRRYVEIGELAVLEQVRADALRLDEQSIAVGPFARLDANAVAAMDGKTRGAITNVFGSQAAFQAETMALALSAEDWVGKIEYPEPAGFATAEEWVDALLAGESARGPVHGASPAVGYATLWALWLSAVPYGLWSERVSRPSLDEQQQHIDRVEEVLAGALDHFRLGLREGTTVPRSRVGAREPGRGRLAQPVPHAAASLEPRRTDRHAPPPLGPTPLARRDRPGLARSLGERDTAEDEYSADGKPHRHGLV